MPGTAVAVAVNDVFDLPRGAVRYPHSGTWSPCWSFTCCASDPDWFAEYPHSGTWSPCWSFSIAAGPAWKSASVGVGFTRALEKPGCINSGRWAGPRLRRDRAGTWREANRGNFPAVGSVFPVFSSRTGSTAAPGPGATDGPAPRANPGTRR